MRRLSESSASRCEHATRQRCKCRCRGTFHGAARGPVVELEPEDPHYAIAKRPTNLFEVEPLRVLEDVVAL